MRQDACVVISTGLFSSFSGPPVITPPDWVEYYKAADGSIVEAVGRFWEAEGRSGLSVLIHQYGPKGEVYRGTCGVESLGQLDELPRMEQSTAEEALYTRDGVEGDR